MAWSDLFAGFAFYMIIEGLLPFASPTAWRRTLAGLAQLDDTQLRGVGLGIVIAGLAILFLVRG